MSVQRTEAAWHERYRGSRPSDVRGGCKSCTAGCWCRQPKCVASCFVRDWYGLLWIPVEEPVVGVNGSVSIVGRSSRHRTWISDCREAFE